LTRSFGGRAERHFDRGGELLESFRSSVRAISSNISFSFSYLFAKATSAG
jgi:hypothetical protein